MWRNSIEPERVIDQGNKEGHIKTEVRLHNLA